MAVEQSGVRVGRRAIGLARAAITAPEGVARVPEATLGASLPVVHVGSAAR